MWPQCLMYYYIWNDCIANTVASKCKYTVVAGWSERSLVKLYLSAVLKVTLLLSSTENRFPAAWMDSVTDAE